MNCMDGILTMRMKVLQVDYLKGSFDRSASLKGSHASVTGLHSLSDSSFSVSVEWNENGGGLH